MYGNRYIISHLSLSVILVPRLKLTCGCQLAFPFTVWAKKCLACSLAVQENEDVGLDTRQKLQRCLVRIGAVGLIAITAMTAERVSALLENIAIFHVDNFLGRNRNTSEALITY